MRAFTLLVLALAACAHGAVMYEPITLNYHEDIGIPEAARIKAAEEAFDAGITTRIVGGSPASLGQFPYQAGLVITLQSGATSVCGASLLTNTRLVTAAHCWFDGRQNARSLTVVLGSIRLFTGGTRIATSSVVIHANYNPRNLNNDIAIITIRSVGFTNIIQSIPRATGTSTFAGASAIASGFGRTSDHQGITQAQFLSHVTIPVITNAQCAQTFGATVVASTICTSGAGGRGTCGGDSGGPVVTNVGGRRVLIGVVSFGAARGCQVGLPAGHARVTSFNAWINARL
uniref:Collagenase 1-like n=1 Tax=Tineola bisselliella TaxID=93883 RepID=A0A891XHA9_TINBI|nr:collagenase 1-like [Tineola bisselliella]